MLAAISVIESEDVFEASIAPSLTTSSNSLKISFLSFGFSVAASITISQSAKSLTSVV